MNATVLYRIAAFVFVMTAVGHTYAILSPHSLSPEARGLGLMGTVSMLFWAFLSWHLGDLARSTPAATGPLGWALFAVQLAGVVLSLLYFDLPPRVLSGLAAILVGLATWLASRCQRIG